MARMDQGEYHNDSWSVPGLRPPDPTMSPDGSSRESNPCRVTYSPRLSPTTHQRLLDTRGKTCKAPAIMTSKAACGLRMSESCSTLVCTAEGQGGTQSSGPRDERPASAPPRSHAPAGNTRMS